jgi:RNA polymerase sigma factor (sigma-70 family)
MEHSDDRTSDGKLLTLYADRADEGAFAALVERHLYLVLSCAMRRLGCRESGEEVALNVFTILSRKAKQMRDHPALEAWLHQTAQFESTKAFRRDKIYRRKMMAYEDHLRSRDTGESVWSKAIEWLDSALLTLTESDCQVLQWHYVEGRSYREIGEMLGATERAELEPNVRSHDFHSGFKIAAFVLPRGR